MEFQPLLFGISKLKKISRRVLCDCENNSEQVDGMPSDLKQICVIKIVMIR